MYMNISKINPFSIADNIILNFNTNIPATYFANSGIR